jgi:hypothetical protein
MRALTQSAQTAKAIRQLLKSQYPTIKFSVVSRNFSMGNSVDVSWNLGPTTKDIDKLISDFQYGHFNGMEDIYEYSNNMKNMPQAKYVHASRDYQTAEEIENSKIGWRKPGWRDLWNLEQSFYHIVGKDICKAAGIEYQGLEMRVPCDKVFSRIIYSYGDNTLKDIVYQLIQDVRFMDGYHGITNCIAEDGSIIKNCFMAY